MALLLVQQCVHLWHQDLQGAAVAQHLDEYLGLILHQRALYLLPAALGGKRLQFAGCADLAHQLARFVGDPKPQRRIAGGEAGHPQYAQRIFGESRGNMTQ